VSPEPGEREWGMFGQVEVPGVLAAAVSR
jgi:hypothetical protein